MKIFIEIPTWLGDAVMVTPAIETIVRVYPDCMLTLFGSHSSIETLRKGPNVRRTMIDDSKKRGNRLLHLKRIAINAGTFDLAFSFRRGFPTKVLFFFIKSKKKFIYKKNIKDNTHQVIKYNNFVNHYLGTEYKTTDLRLHFNKFTYNKQTLGINPGATYGSAKRWYPEEFAKVALALCSKYNIVIFGGSDEVQIANDIQSILEKERVSNIENIAGKTTIPQLIERIAGLDLFLTNDSGPMHIAAAFKIKTVAIFGPTKNDVNFQTLKRLYQRPK